MKFATIEPAESRWTIVEADNLFDLYQPLGLARLAVDHGVILPAHAGETRVGISIVVEDGSLFKPPSEQRYFVIGRKLFAGNAVLYGWDETGDTTDLPAMPMVIFLSLKGIEMAIEADQIDRPTMAINDDIIWTWPGPGPFEMHS